MPVCFGKSDEDLGSCCKIPRSGGVERSDRYECELSGRGVKKDDVCLQFCACVDLKRGSRRRPCRKREAFGDEDDQDRYERGRVYIFMYNRWVLLKKKNPSCWCR